MAGDAAPKKKCFVLSPIGESGGAIRIASDTVMKHLIKKALSSEYEITRADDDTNPGAITPRIVARIMEADLIVADLSGYNANVFYELAIAHGFDKQTIHIQKADERAPFDVKDMRIVPYDTTDPDALEAAQKKLREYAAHAATRPNEIETPLSSAGRFAAVQSSTDPVAESNVQVTEAINALRLDVSRVLRRVNTPRAVEQNPEQMTANQRSLTRIIKRILADGRGTPDDFASVITESTSPGFDRWARDQLVGVFGVSDADDANVILMDDSLTVPMDDDPTGANNSGSDG